MKRALFGAKKELLIILEANRRSSQATYLHQNRLERLSS
jgi:hypothetical protein